MRDLRSDRRVRLRHLQHQEEAAGRAPAGVPGRHAGRAAGRAARTGEGLSGAARRSRRSSKPPACRSRKKPRRSPSPSQAESRRPSRKKTIGRRPSVTVRPSAPPPQAQAQRSGPTQPQPQAEAQWPAAAGAAAAAARRQRRLAADRTQPAGRGVRLARSATDALIAHSSHARWTWRHASAYGRRHELHRRHRRPAECRQVDAVQPPGRQAARAGR